MVDESQSYNNLKPDVTLTGAPSTSSAAGGCPAPEKADVLILDCLTKSDIELEPKEIAFRTGLKPSTARGICRRLAHSNKIVRGVAGYKIPKVSLDDHLGKLLRLDDSEQTLPKIHDIHLTFLPRNIFEAMKRPEIWDPIQKVSYSLHRGSVEKKSPNAYIHSYQTIASLSGIDWLDRLFNPLDEDSIFIKWEFTTQNASGVKGGYQESFDFKTYRVTVMLYGKGSMKVIIANSKHPFDAIEFKNAINKIDGIFVARIGVRFIDISNLFFIEQVHIGNDVVGDLGFSGKDRLNCTVSGLDNWIYRVYEKVLGPEMVVRTEACLEGGNYNDHNMNAFQAFTTGGLPPQLINAQIFKLTKNQDEMRDLILRQQNSIHDLVKGYKNVMDFVTKEHQNGNHDQPAPAAAPVITPGPSSPGASPAQKRIDGTGPDKELAPEKAGAYLGKLKEATKKKAAKSTPLTKEETWQVLEAFEKIRKKEGS